MMIAKPRSMFSWDYEVLNGGESIAMIDFAWFREKGEIEVEGEIYQIGRGSWLGDFFLQQDGEDVVSATKMSAFLRCFEVRFGPHVYTLRAASPFQRTFVLEEDGLAIGKVRPVGLFSRKAEIDFPEELPLAVQLFLTWLTLLLWKRQHQSE